MATNEFKPFAIGVGANVTPQAEWETLPALLSGFTTGKASSAQVNKAIRQASFIASAVAQYISDALNKDVLDNGDTAAFVLALKQSIITGSVPAGIPMPWPTATAPAGWLKCNGASFSTATYPLLAKAYPSGILPDLRGEFIRGWDDGRGVDSGRQVLSSQTDAMQPIVGSFGYGSNGIFTYVDGAFKGVNRDSGDGVVTVATSISQYKQAKLDSSTVTRTATETRPRNISFNFIVRAA